MLSELLIFGFVLSFLFAIFCGVRVVSLAHAYRINEQIRLTTSNGSSEAVNDRKTDNAMAKRKTTTDLRSTAQKTKA
jgi:stage III sporulation protein SpoIIIAA